VDGSVRDARQPQAAVDADGGIHVVFGSGDSIYYCQSDDGTTYSSPTLVSAAGKLSLGMRRGPRVAVTDQTVVVTAIAGEQGAGRDGDVLAWRSADGGATWGKPIRVNDVEGSAREGLHGMAASRDGHLYCVWLDLRSGKTELFGAASHDGGATWSENSLVYHSPSGSVCECCHPSVAYDHEGTLHVLWRNSVGGNRDMYLATSQDGGRAFGKASKLGTGTWPLDACPMDGGAVAVSQRGKVTTVWRRERQVFTVGASRKEQLLGDGEQPWCTAAANGAYVVWISQRPGELWLRAPGSRRPEKVADGANDPMIASASHGLGPIVLVWETRSGDSHIVMAKVIEQGP
jgi:hypothetical protein